MVKEIDTSQLIPGNEYFITKYNITGAVYFKLKGTFSHVYKGYRVISYVFKNYTIIRKVYPNQPVPFPFADTYNEDYYFIVKDKKVYFHHYSNHGLSSLIRYFVTENESIIKKARERLFIKAMQCILSPFIKDTYMLLMITVPYLCENPLHHPDIYI